jgi:hypothetical protein
VTCSPAWSPTSSSVATGIVIWFLVEILATPLLYQ